MKTMELERSKDELQRQYELEISNLSNKITILQNNAEDTSELQRLRVIQREKNDLELKVRSLLQELDDIRAAKEELRIQSEKDERLFKRQLADQISVGKSFQSEKDSLQSKCNVLEDEMRVIQRQKEDLVQELNRLRKELDKVVNRLEENAHQYTVSISDLKINYLKDKNEASIQIEELNNKINHLQVDQDTITEQKEKISSQERDYLDKIRLAREEEWSKISILEQEKHELEKQISVWKHTHSESESKNEGLQKEFVQVF
jgi:chromosome segregation ATPase